MKNKSDLEIIKEVEKIYEELKKLKPCSNSWLKNYKKYEKFSSELIARHEEQFNKISYERNVGSFWTLVEDLKKEIGVI